MSNVKIRMALEKRLDTLTPAWPITWENVDPSDTQAIPKDHWMKANIIYGRTGVGSLGTSGADKWLGYLQVSVFIKRNTGLRELTDRIQEILDYFPRGLSLIESPVEVVLQTPYVQELAPEDNWFGKAVIIPWYAYVF